MFANEIIFLRYLNSNYFNILNITFCSSEHYANDMSLVDYLIHKC